MEKTMSLLGSNLLFSRPNHLRDRIYGYGGINPDIIWDFNHSNHPLKYAALKQEEEKVEINKQNIIENERLLETSYKIVDYQGYSFWKAPYNDKLSYIFNNSLNQVISPEVTIININDENFVVVNPEYETIYVPYNIKNQDNLTIIKDESIESIRETQNKELLVDTVSYNNAQEIYNLTIPELEDEIIESSNEPEIIEESLVPQITANDTIDHFSEGNWIFNEPEIIEITENVLGSEEEQILEEEDTSFDEHDRMTEEHRRRIACMDSLVTKYEYEDTEDYISEEIEFISDDEELDEIEKWNRLLEQREMALDAMDGRRGSWCSDSDESSYFYIGKEIELAGLSSEVEDF